MLYFVQVTPEGHISSLLHGTAGLDMLQLGIEFVM